MHIGFARYEMSRVNIERNLGYGDFIWITGDWLTLFVVKN